MNKYRTHLLKDINESLAGQDVVVSGWVENIRDHGGVLFLDLRDETSTLQTVSNDDDMFKGIAKESVVKLTGKIRRREEGTENDRISTGNVEMVVDSLEMLGSCVHELPFEIMTSKQTKDDVRLKYRYLDMRNEAVKKNMVLRSDILHFLRNKMYDLGFTEVQTPILTASSPEGARDYLVPSRNYPGEFYALPQAPQQFKQLLMTSGFDRYFQIAPCFRDEDARADRSPGEFYQLDMEMCFADQEDVFSVIEKVLPDVFAKYGIYKSASSVPFKRITYKDALETYGSDKPDLRIDLTLKDISSIASKTEFADFKDTYVTAVNVSNFKESRKYIDSLVEEVTTSTGNKVYWFKVDESGELTGGISKFLEPVKEELFESLNLESNSFVAISAGKKLSALKTGGVLIKKLGSSIDGHMNKETYEFCWIVDFPMYEIGEESGELEFCHNPFSMPQGGLKVLEEAEGNLERELEIVAYQYDLVCNGVELSSGAVRNHDPEIMIKAFELVGLGEEDVKKKFPAMYNAFCYGAPSHAGIAPGVDRMIMLITGEESIREVIPFPMNSKAQDLLMGSPCKVGEKQLKDVHIKVID